MIAPRQRYPFLALVPLLAMVACGGGDSEADADAAADSIASAGDAAAAMSQAMQAASGGPTLTPDELRARLPATAAGQPQVDLQTVTAGPLTTVTARYEGDDERRIDIAIVNAGAMATRMAQAWAMTTFDRRTADGFERTADFQGLHALEKESRDASGVSSSLDVLAGNYVVQLKGQAVDLQVLHDIADGLDIPALAH